jgi:hypothetical protein
VVAGGHPRARGQTEALNYAIKAAQALIHLRSIDATVVSPKAHSLLAEVVAAALPKKFDRQKISSIEDFERALNIIALERQRVRYASRSLWPWRGSRLTFHVHGEPN